MRFAVPTTTVLAVALLAAPALAAGPITLTIKDHRFAPEKITAPAGERVQLVVVNEDGTPEEFESRELRIEKFVAPKGRITLTVGPRKAGDYAFFGDFHPETAKGTLTFSEGR